jgi:hypothetical protein
LRGGMPCRPPSCFLGRGGFVVNWKKKNKIIAGFEATHFRF